MFLKSFTLSLAKLSCRDTYVWEVGVAAPPDLLYGELGGSSDLRTGF